MESATSIAEILCRYTILENLYLRHESDATNELKRALVQFYAAILVYLSKVKSYFDQNTKSLYHTIAWHSMQLIMYTGRILTSALLDESHLDESLGRITTEQVTVDHWIGLVNAQS